MFRSALTRHNKSIWARPEPTKAPDQHKYQRQREIRWMALYQRYFPSTSSTRVLPVVPAKVQTRCLRKLRTRLHKTYTPQGYRSGDQETPSDQAVEVTKRRTTKSWKAPGPRQMPLRPPTPNGPRPKGDGRRRETCRTCKVTWKPAEAKERKTKAKRQKQRKQKEGGGTKRERKEKKGRKRTQVGQAAKKPRR